MAARCSKRAWAGSGCGGRVTPDRDRRRTSCRPQESPAPDSPTHPVILFSAWKFPGNTLTSRRSRRLQFPQPATYGPDTIADIYGARVVLNDVSGAPRGGRRRSSRDVDEGRIRAVSAGGAPDTGGDVRPRRAPARALRSTLILAAVFRGIGLAFPPDPLVSVPAAVSEFRVLRRPLRLRSGRLVFVMLACVMAALLLARGGRRRIATLLIAVATAMKLLPCTTCARGCRVPPRGPMWVW